MKIRGNPADVRAIWLYGQRIPVRDLELDSHDDEGYLVTIVRARIGPENVVELYSSVIDIVEYER